MARQLQNNQVTLIIEGKEYRGWLSLSISVALQSLARGFSATITRNLNGSKHLLEANVGDSVQVKIDNDLVITGYLTELSFSYSEKSITVLVRGASKTIDLVECTLPPGIPKSIKNISIVDGIQRICEPFGISVVDQVGDKTRIDFDISPEQKVGDFLKNIIKKQSLLITDNEDGDLVICKIGSSESAKDALELGGNVLTAKRETKTADRYKTYTVIGQAANPNSELSSQSSSLSASVTDDQFKRTTRSLTSFTKGNVSNAELMVRAALLRDIAKANADKLAYTVWGWRQSNNALWKVNSYVMVRDSFFGITESYLVSKVTYEKDGAGTKCTLELKHPDAFRIVSDADKSKTVATDFSLLKKNSGKTNSANWTNQ